MIIINKKERVKISIVIPTYNGSAFIADALNSIFTQNRLPDEIVVVDDASSDGTPDLVVSVSRDAPLPVKIIRLSKNSGGPARPINVGISVAQGEIIAVCDQDDVLLPDKIETQASILSENQSLMVVFSLSGDYALDTQELNSRQRSQIEMLRKVGNPAAGFIEIPGAEAFRLLMSWGNYITGFPGFMFRKRDWQARGGLDERLKIASDYDFLCDLTTRGAAAFIPRIQYLRRSHGSNMTCRVLETNVETFSVLADYAKKYEKILLDSRSTEEIARRFLGFAYWARESHNYKIAFLTCINAFVFIGYRTRFFLFTLKLIPHWICRWILGKSPTYSSLTAPDSVKTGISGPTED